MPQSHFTSFVQLTVQNCEAIFFFNKMSDFSTYVFEQLLKL